MKDFFLPFKGVFCRVEPLAFDGTLSFLECLAKLQDYANKLNANITAINNLIEAIETELEGKQDTLTFDTTPTDGSNNPVTSNGIFDALAGKQNTLTFDTTPTDGSNNPVTSDGIFDALAGKQNNLTFDTAPTNGSTNPVTSDGIFDALAGKQNELTFDADPTENSRNPVFSGGVYNALVNIETEVSHLQPETFTYDNVNQRTTTDKTFAQLVAAYNLGKPIIAVRSISTTGGDVVIRAYMTPVMFDNNSIFAFTTSIVDGFEQIVETWILTSADQVRNSRAIYATEASMESQIQDTLDASTDYTNSREQAIREDFTNKFFDVHVSSIVSPVLPSGVTYAIINEKAANGCVVRMHFLDAGMWLYYTDVCAFMGYDAGNDSTIVAKIAQDGTISFA